MMSNDQKNEMEMMVLTDLAGICKKLADTPGFPDSLRAQAREFGNTYDSLLPYEGQGIIAQPEMVEALLGRIARFLPRVLEVESDEGVVAA
jgi:hypothetical protein